MVDRSRLTNHELKELEGWNDYDILDFDIVEVLTEDDSLEDYLEDLEGFNEEGR